MRSTYAHSIRYALNAAFVKSQWYEQDGDIRFLKELADWVDVANIYLKQHCLENDINLNNLDDSGNFLLTALESEKIAA